MIGAVDQRGLQVYDGITGEHAFLDRVAQAFFHGGEEVLGHRAAEHVFLKYEVAFRAGLELDPHMSVLAVAARLFLVLALALDFFLMVSR